MIKELLVHLLDPFSITIFAVHDDQELGLEQLFLVLFVEHFGHHGRIVVVDLSSGSFLTQRYIFDRYRTFLDVFLNRVHVFEY